MTSASTTGGDDPEGAYTLAYDAARETAAALLAHQACAPTSAGGHIVIIEAMMSHDIGIGRTCVHGSSTSQRQTRQETSVAESDCVATLAV